ncbi:MAG: tetratricopeptide repeat protein [Verrucomicrobiota bacterium]
MTITAYHKSAAGLLCFIALFAYSAGAQSIILKAGQKIDTLGLRRDGDLIMGKVQVGTGSGEVGYKAEQIAKIEFPEPRALKAATGFLTQGQPEKALAEIDPVVRYYEPFKEVAGAWWAQAAAIKVSVLAALHREVEGETLTNEILKTVTDPETARSVQLRLAGGLIRKKEFEKAIAICNTAISQSGDTSILAEAWIKKGDVLLAQRQFDDALLAYLHVPVFYSDEKEFLPGALLGSARVYWRLDDAKRATKTLNDLIAAYPRSVEAALAQSELQKIDNHK